MALPRPRGTDTLGLISGENRPGQGAGPAQSLPETGLFLLPRVCLCLYESWAVSASLCDFPTLGPLSLRMFRQLWNAFTAAPDSPREGESLFFCLLLLSVLLISRSPCVPCGEQLLGEASLQQSKE